MTKQNETMTDIIPTELTDALAEAVTQIAPPEARATELKSRVMARIHGKKSFDLITIRATEGEWITLATRRRKKKF